MMPTCIMPMTGTRVPIYQNQPTARYGLSMDARTINNVAIIIIRAEPKDCHRGIAPGNG